MANDAEIELVKDLQRGDSSGFEKTVRLLGPRLLASAARLLGSRDEAQDAVQETFLSVWKNIGKFEGASSLYSWAHRILINACLAGLRSSRGTKEVGFSAFERDGSTASPNPLDRIQDQDGPTIEKQIAMIRRRSSPTAPFDPGAFPGRNTAVTRYCSASWLKVRNPTTGR